MLPNTIYVLATGNYNISNQIDAASCTALIAEGDVIIKKSADDEIIYLSSDNNVILDHLSLDGSTQSYSTD